MLASTIQFTTNTPTPNKQPQTMITRIGGVRSGALLQNPDSMPSPKPHPSLPKDKAMSKNEFSKRFFLPFQNISSLERR